MSSNLMAVTAALPGVVAAVSVPTTETTVYTCPASATATISAASVANNSNAPITIQVSVVKAGGTAGTANRAAIVPLRAYDSVRLDEIIGHSFAPGDFISALASVAGGSIVVSAVVAS